MIQSKPCRANMDGESTGSGSRYIGCRVLSLDEAVGVYGADDGRGRYKRKTKECPQPLSDTALGPDVPS